VEIEAGKINKASKRNFTNDPPIARLGELLVKLIANLHYLALCLSKQRLPAHKPAKLRNSDTNNPPRLQPTQVNNF
jgi:hypothetical protein